MRNLADVIESFIIQEMVQEQEKALLVQRNELAERLSCAPSQISYVLSTRFTPERGFMVESRRGSGGFIRIVRTEPLLKQLLQEPTSLELLGHLAEQKLITAREKALLQYMLNILDIEDEEKKKVLKQAMGAMNKAERR